jgi:nucleoid DNA-binding protein
MAIEDYIKDLLYRYDCVIIPNFGGFVTNKISAKIHQDSNTFYPPTKQIGFNVNLIHNDGLLANYIASSENISFDQASAKIKDTVSRWNKLIKTSSVDIKNIGSFSMNDKNQLIFNPTNTINYLKSSFGLAPTESTAIVRTVQKVIPLVTSKKSQRKVPLFIKYAATALVLLSLSYVGWTGYENKQEQLNFAKDQKKLEEKIQTATFVIENPLETIELNVNKEVPKSFHVIAGAFQFVENAHKKVNQLNSKGFNATILGTNKWGLTQVAYASFYKKSDAFQSLADIRKIDSKDAWLLVKKFE